MSDPDPRDLCAQLRRACGLFDGAMPITPAAAWAEALERVAAYRLTLEQIARSMSSDWPEKCQVSVAAARRVLQVPRRDYTMDEWRRDLDDPHGGR